MSSVGLLFCNSRDPLSLAIRAFTWSRWSHVALVDGYDVIEALAPEGVQAVDLGEVTMRSREFELVDLPCRDPSRVIAAASAQIGKPYDYSALLGLALRRNWQEDDAWFCSELIAWAFEAAGEPLFRADSLQRVTPQHLWMLAPAQQRAASAPNGWQTNPSAPVDRLTR